MIPNLYKLLKFSLVYFIGTILFISCGEDKINVLIFSGQNNHDWEETTPSIKSILEESNKFTVEVTDNPQKLNPNKLLQYDVILSNWNTWPEITGKRWDTDVEKAFTEFVANGKSIVIVHAGSSSLQDWDEFQKISGGTWELGKTGHGPVHTFKVEFKNKLHPITNGLNEFYIKDELWHNTKFQKDIEVLAEAYSSKEKGGSGDKEPVYITTKFGKGRGFYSVLGHNKFTMRNAAWKTLLLRGTEWAATGEVTIQPLQPWPNDNNAGRNQSELSWKQTDSTISLFKNNNILWQLNIPKIGKPYFHPINSNNDNTLTWVKPDDHPWHYGLWFSWKYINGVNYWEEDRETGLAEGITVVTHKDVEIYEDHTALVNLIISYQTQEGLTVLFEERKLTISSPKQNGDFHIDWKSRFTPNKLDVVLERTPIEGQEGGRPWGGYATLGLRIDSRDFNDIQLLNNNGKTGLSIHTTPTRWTDISGVFSDEENMKAGIAVFEHPSNPRYPYPGYVIDSPLKEIDARFIYTGSGFLYASGYELKTEETLNLQYRIYVHNDLGNLEQINIKYEEFISN